MNFSRAPLVSSDGMSKTRNEETIESAQAQTAEDPPAEAEGSLFCPRCGAEMGAADVFCGSCGWRLDQAADPAAAAAGGRVVANPSDLNRLTALLLCFFLGWLGAHRFYVGKIGTAAVFLVTGGFLFVGVIYDCVMIATGEFTDAQGRKLHYWQ